MALDQATNTFDEFLLSPRGDKLIRINISRNTLIAVIVSLLLHVLILFLIVPHIPLNNASAPPTSIEVSLAPPKQAEKVIEPPLPEPVPEKPPEPPAHKVIKTKPKVMTQKPNRSEKPPFTVPDVLATPKPVPEVVPPAKEAPADMMAYVNQQRAKRQASETDAAQQNADAAAREVGLTDEQKRDERIKNNFQNGTNGIFTITSLNGRNGTFSFLGWTTSLSNAKRQFFEVEAKPGQDVRLLMIKRMISLIREHYQGDFDWNSSRLGKVIKLSARPEDNAGLEDFIMTEFFGPNYKNAS